MAPELDIAYLPNMLNLLFALLAVQRGVSSPDSIVLATALRLFHSGNTEMAATILPCHHREKGAPCCWESGSIGLAFFAESQASGGKRQAIPFGESFSLTVEIQRL